MNKLILIALSAGLAMLPAMANADDTPATQPTLVTLHVQDVNARDILKRITDRAGMTAEVFPPWLWTGNNGSPVMLITMDMDNKPFWLALGEFCKAAHCGFYPNQGNGSLQIHEKNSGPTQGDLPDSGLGGVACESGSYVAVAQSIQRNSSINLENGLMSHNDSVQLAVYADPATKILGYSQPILDTADDENGHSMLPDNQPSLDQMMNQPFSSAFQAQAGAMIKFPPQPGLSLANLSGTINIKVPKEVRTLTIDDVAAAVGKTTKVDDYSMTITSFQMHGVSGDISMVVNHTPAGQPSPVVQGLSHMIFGGNTSSQPDYLMYKLQGDAITLVDADGKILHVNGGGGGGVDQVQWQISVNAGSQPGWGKAPIKLIWKITTQTTIDSVHFQFKNLPLPQQ